MHYWDSIEDTRASTFLESSGLLFHDDGQLSLPNDVNRITGKTASEIGVSNDSADETPVGRSTK